MLKVSGEITLEFRALILNVFCFLLLLATYSAFVRPESGPFEVLSFAKCANRGPCFWFVCALSLSLFLSRDLWCFRHTRNWSLRRRAGFA